MLRDPEPHLIDITQCSDQALLTLLFLAAGEANIDNPFDDKMHRAIISEAWQRGYLAITQLARDEYKSTNSSGG